MEEFISIQGLYIIWLLLVALSLGRDAKTDDGQSMTLNVHSVS